jgi:hypothetical protein
MFMSMCIDWWHLLLSITFLFFFSQQEKNISVYSVISQSYSWK